MNRNLDQMKLSGIRAYTNLAANTAGCALLTLGEPDFDTPQAICQVAADALAGGMTHYAPNQGLPALRQAIARWETDRGNPCDESRVLITAGATGALFTALLGLLNPGDEVIVPMPAFPLYDSILQVAGAKRIPLQTGDFQITPEDLQRVITEKTRAIVLNSPNNPTGSVLTEASLQAVKQAVVGTEIAVIWDGVYQQLAEGDVPDLCLDADLRDRIYLCQSFSKPYAMTGWRLGYLIVPQGKMEKFLLLHAAELASIPTFLQQAALTALETDISEMVQIYNERRGYVCRRLREMGLTFPEPKGAFYVFPRVAEYGLTDEEFCRRLITEGKVATVPGSCFGMPGYLRISCACSMDTLKTGLDRLENFLKAHKKEEC